MPSDSDLTPTQVISLVESAQPSNIITPVLKKKSGYLSTIQMICRYVSVLSLSMLHGYNHTSSHNVIEYSKKHFASDFLLNNSRLAANLPPTFFYFGGLLAISLLFNMNYKNFNKVLVIGSLISGVSYLATMLYPHIFMIYAMKVLVGFASGMISLVLPQILFRLGETSWRNLKMALFPIFLLMGLAIPIGLIPLSFDYFYIINSIPIIISGIGFTTSIFSTEHIQIKRKNDDNKEIGLINFITNPKTLKSANLIYFVQLAYRMTGVDFIGLFSNELFVGPNSHLLGMIPFGVAILLLVVNSWVSKKFGRKNSFVTGIAFISIPCFLFYFFEMSIITLLSFSGILNIFIGSLPFIIPNEVVEPSHQSVANEFSTILIYILSIAVALYIAFIFTEGSRIIWLPFAIFSLIIAVILTIIMVEPLEDGNMQKFVKKFNNISSWKKFRSKPKEKTLE